MPEEFGTTELIREFLDEAEEHFRVLNRDLLDMESAVVSGADTSSDLVDEMFRAVHTLKGLSAMFDLVGVKELAHKVETVFDLMRKQKLTPDQECLDLLFTSVDALQRGLAAFEEGDDDASALADATGDVVAYLERVSAVVEQPRAITGGRKTWGEYARARLERAAKDGLRTVVIRLRWGIELRLGALRVRDVESALGPMGEVLEIGPVLSDLPDIAAIHATESDLAFDIVVITDWTNQVIADRLGVGLGAFTEIRMQATDDDEVRSATGDAASAGSSPPAGRKAAGGSRVAEVVRVDIRRLDELVELTGELVTARTSLQELSARLLAEHRKDESVITLHQVVKGASALVDSLQDSIMGLRMVEIDHVFTKFPRIVRDLVRTSGKEIHLVVEGGDTEMDKRVIEQVEDPLLHILRNACDHGIESAEVREAAGKPREGTIRLSAWYEGSDVIVQCADDGAGLDVVRIIDQARKAGTLAADEVPTPERVAEIIMSPGFTTAEAVTQVSGRGVGLDVVRRKAMELGGRVEVVSHPGVGTTFTLRLPLTMAIIPALIVWASDRRFAIPLSVVKAAFRSTPEGVATVHGREVLDMGDATVVLFRLRDLLALEGDAPQGRFFVVETVVQGQRCGLGVDGLVGQQEIVVKTLDETFGAAEGISGATILGDGTVVPIIDVEGLVGRSLSAGQPERAAVAAGGGA